MANTLISKKGNKILDYILRINKSTTKNKNVDIEFIKKIQPQGGIGFAERYIKNGDGYVSSVFVYDYPTEVEELWFVDILNIKDTIVNFDISTYKKNSVLHDINNSLKEYSLRYSYDKDAIDKLSAKDRHGELVDLYKNISTNAECIKNVKLRIFVYAKTILEMDEKIKIVLEKLECAGCKGTVLLNETKTEYDSLFDNYTNQLLADKREGKGIGSNALGAGLPFYSASLKDKYGMYLGNSITNAPVILDLFSKESNRKSFNALVMGLMGAGKSTLLKKIIIDNVIRGNIIRCFDITGEMEQIVSELGGSYVTLDGTNNVINPLEIFRTNEDEYANYLTHISKLSNFFEYLSPGLRDEDKEQLELLIRELYVKFNLVPNCGNCITGINSKNYPILTDLLNLLQEKIYDYIHEDKGELSPTTLTKLSRLERLELKLNSIIYNFGHLFNRHSTINNLLDKQFICFNIRNLTSLKKEIFNAQLFSTLSMLWDELINKGSNQKKLYEDGEISIEQVQNYLLIIDEAAKIINTKNSNSVDYITAFAREARKYFGSIIMAMHSVRDSVLEGAQSEEVNAIRTLFELMQYKIVMQQDSNSSNVLKDVFKKSLSEKEIEAIPVFKTGEAIISITGSKNIRLNIKISKEEEKLFKGGI